MRKSLIRGLDMTLSFDSSLHIKRAVNLVKGNLGIGIALALLMLYAMIQGVRSTLLISITIPVSLSAAILGLGLLDRTLNIISLAGLAFSTGLISGRCYCRAGEHCAFTPARCSARQSLVTGRSGSIARRSLPLRSPPLPFLRRLLLWAVSKGKCSLIWR